MQIKNLVFESPFFLAPLAGYTDAPFRHIAHDWHSACAVTEMVSAEGLARNSGKTEDLLARYEGEEKLIVQLFAPSRDPVQRCLDRLLKHDPAMIDINCGCPVPKVVKTGAGSAMMRHIDDIYDIVSFLCANAGCPVSVKFRLGWDSGSINWPEFASACASAGASMLTLHARTRSQMYSGKADWTQIRKLKEMFRDTDVKIFASGDLFTAEDGISVMRQTGCDGVMFARGAIGNPFIFTRAEELLKGNSRVISTDEIRNTMLRHLDYMIEHYGSEVGCRDMRKHAVHYVKGLAEASRVKAVINSARTRQDYLEALSLLEDI